MNDGLILAVGVLVFGLMLAGIALTIVEFRTMPRRQPPEFDNVASQAQPDPSPTEESAARG